MMRYQRVSPDVLPLSNGRKPTLRTCKEDDSSDGGGAARIPAPYSSPFDAKPLRPRSGSGSANPSPDNHHHHHFPHFSLSPDPVPSPPAQTATAATVTAASLPAAKSQTGLDVSNGRCAADRGGDVILQWGHNKRSRGSRAESRGAAASASASAAAAADESSTVHPRQMIKIQRRAAIIGAERMAAAAMPPPPSATTSYVRGASLRPVMPLRDSTGSLHSRTVEDRSGGHSRADKRSPPSPPDKPHHASRTAPNGCGSDAGAASANPESKPPSDRDTAGTSGGGASTATEKLNLEHFEWPRIYISLSRKEKEDDFLAMKGTKLPQRPKKRAKNIDKALQYCFPGMWLSDLTRGRYEVREKKCVKKKRRGLKGMESMDSDSE